MNQQQQIKDLKAKLKIAQHALARIVNTKGLEGDTVPPWEIARRAKFNIKHYKTFIKTHDVEDD